MMGRVMKLVKKVGRMKPQSGPRPFVMTLMRGKRKVVYLRRNYKELENAVIKAQALLLREGEPGDVAEVVHNVTGTQLGTVKLLVKGRMVTDWLWERG